MIRLLAVTAALAVLLSGCTRTLPEVTEPATETAGVETVPYQSQPPRKTVAERCAEADLGDASAVFVSDGGTGQLVYCSTDPTQRLYPASITKLFTAWVALRFLPGDAVITAGWELGMLEPGSSSAFLALDSRLAVQDLICGMLLPSGNDAALVLAAGAGRELSGRTNATAREAVAEFVAEMNRAAEAVGLENTHFENPHGCHSENHYSCPADLAVMAALALDEPLIRRAMGLSEITVTARSGQVYAWRNTNRLVREDLEGCFPEAIGMKTGYTDAAGYCLMAAFDEAAPLVVGVFGSSDSESRYAAAVELYRICSAEEPDIQSAVLHQKIQSGAG